MGPGAYEQNHLTIASAAADLGKDRGATRFTYGTAPSDIVDVSAAQMAYEAKGIDFINAIHQGSDGWLRSDFHRYLVAADHRAHYVQQRKLQTLARQQMECDEQHYRDRGRSIAAATAEHRELLDEQKKQLQQKKHDEVVAMRRAASERAELLKLKGKAYAQHAAHCVNEAKSLSTNARRTRADVQEMRATHASEMRARQAAAKQAARAEQQKRDEAVRAAWEATRANRVPSPVNVADDTGPSFVALTKAEKVAVDEANAEAQAARERAKERARSSRKKAEERAAEANKGVRQFKNLSQLVREEAIARAAAQKEKVRLEAEQAAAAAAAAAAAEARAAEEAARAAAEAEARESAAQAERDAQEAAERKVRERRSRAEQQKKAAEKRMAELAGGAKKGAKSRDDTSRQSAAPAAAGVGVGETAPASAPAAQTAREDE